jgi:hypothetical protein
MSEFLLPSTNEISLSSANKTFFVHDNVPFRRNTVGDALWGACYVFLSGHKNRKRARKISFFQSQPRCQPKHIALSRNQISILTY